MNPIARLAVALLALGLTAPPAFPADAPPDFVVATDGNDSNPGTAAKPFATIGRAQEAVRTRLASLPARNVRVAIRGGEYTLTQPILFSPQDSPPPPHRVTYAAWPDEKPVFSGGRTFSGWTPGPNGVWTARIPPENAQTFEQLFVDGRHAIRARSPNRFCYYTECPSPTQLDPKTGKRADIARRSFIARPADIAPLAALSPEDQKRVTVEMYHSWATSRHHLQSADPDGLMMLRENAKWPILKWGQRQRYHIENFREALDAPGEWFAGRDGTISYMPRDGEDMTQARIVAPTLDELVRFEGNPAAGRFVERISLSGLAFAYARVVPPPKDLGDAQAASGVPTAAVVADGAREIEIAQCEIRHVGAAGVWFRTGCTSCTLARSYVHDLGAGGIRVGETNHRNIPPAEQTAGIRLDNNIIRDGGHVYKGGVGVLIGNSGHNHVTHNEIADFRYSGVSVGWRWGYSPSLAQRNRIAFNRIRHIGWGALSDMGGIYTLGISSGTLIANNVIHDVYSYDHYGAGGWGIYNDQASTGIVMENNLVYNTKTGGYDLHYGKNLLLRNNILAYSMQGQLRRGKIENHHALTVERNIVFWSGGPLLIGNWQDDTVALRNNIYWDTTTRTIEVVKGLDFTAWQALGKDAGSTVTHPLFMAPEKRDFRLPPESPAAQIGFVPFDCSRAGVYGDADWRALADSVQYPPVEFAPDPPPPPPRRIDEGFEGLQPGAAPEMFDHVVTENKGDRIEITSATAATGRLSMRLIDAPDLKQDYNPHVFFQNVQHERGVSRLAFDIRLDAGAEAWIAWRQYPPDEKFRPGPELRIRRGALEVTGNRVCDLPEARWFGIEMLCAVGDAPATRTWHLSITPRGPTGETPPEPWRFENLPLPDPKWNALDYVGFISIGKTRAMWYLDDIKLMNDPLAGWPPHPKEAAPSAKKKN